MKKIKFMGKSQQLKDCYTLDEEIEIYNDCLRDVHDNPRWYLDNLHMLASFRVSWKDYRYKYPTIPYEYTFKGKKNQTPL